MKIFLITDIHHEENSNYPNLGGLEYVNVFGEHFKKLILTLKNEMESCDLAINLGDFIHDENQEKDIETYREAMTLLSSQCPTKHVPGNHDLKNLSKETFSSLVGEEKSYYSFDLGGYHHIVLDGNATEPRGPMYISEEQLLWLQEDLETTQLKAIIYCHHPLDNQSMSENYYFKERPERASINNKFFVRNVLRKSEKVLAVFSGHTHFYSKQEIDGITYYTIPSFTENDGNNSPKAEYGVATLEGDRVALEIKKADFKVL
jgi:alkaline phosphatase